MKSKRIKWNQKKNKPYVSYVYIRRMNELLRKIQSPIQKDKSQFEFEITLLYKQLNNKIENKRILIKYLRENKLRGQFKQLIDIPNNIYRSFSLKK